MIINLNQFGNGGGGGYTLPVATSEILGGVMVGSGLSITSAGTLSADGVDLSNYVQEQELSGYVQTSAMSAYQTTEGMSGYVPTTQVATTGQTGLVKIGSGITLEEDGTISVEGGGGQGIEIVTQLPASGTDGQTVLLIENIPYKKIELTQSSQNITGITIGITSKTALYNYWWINRKDYVYVNPDNSIEVYDSMNDVTTVFSAGTVDGQYIIQDDRDGTTFINYGTINVTDSGFTFVFQDNIVVENKIASVETHQEEKEVLYTWSSNPLAMASVDYTENSGANQNWLVRWKFSDIPNNTKLFVIKYQYGEVYRHFWYEDGAINAYTTNSPSAETASTHFTVAQYQVQNVGVPTNVQDGTMDWSRMYWTDDEIIIYSTGANIRYWFNLDGIYRTGWHKETENKVSNKVFYLDYIWYDGDYNPIIKNYSYPMYAVGLKINPNSNYNTPFTVYSTNNSTIGPIFAPTTTGTTGYVCVAGNGWAAPTWVSPETITNGVKFWKGTQAEYDALSGGTGYDASTMYIIIPD